MPGFANAARELRQETSLSVPESRWSRVGDLYISSEDDEKQIQLFEISLDCQAQVESTDELQDLTWFKENDLPYDKMPKDYRLWLPHILGGYMVTAFFEAHDSTIHGRMFGSPKNNVGRMIEFQIPKIDIT